jgi:oligopeptide/dipeptide ABC transporter ATP-binding protein
MELQMTRTRPLLEVSDLRVAFKTPQGELEAVRGVSLVVEGGRVAGIVGESGSGKSVAMLAAMGLLPPNAIVSGSVKFHGNELLGRPSRELAKIRGARIAMIFQDPLTALNPVIKVGDQIAEAIRLHNSEISKKAASARAVELLDRVAIPQPSQRANQYPHEFSGGMRQRAMIAMAVANDPELLIADEPTTALDVTVQAQILQVLENLRISTKIGLILITHDLGMIAGTADSISVMYGGCVVEFGSVDDVFYHSRHPYTHGLLSSLPKLDGEEETLYSIDGAPPSLIARPDGCSFHPRCPYAAERCLNDEPVLRLVDKVQSACHRAENFRNGMAASMTDTSPQID